MLTVVTSLEDNIYFCAEKNFIKRFTKLKKEMKKYLFIAMAAVAMTFTSCKNEPATTTAPGEGEEKEENVEAEYTAPIDSLDAAFAANDANKFQELLTQAQAKIEEFKESNPAKANEILAAVQKFLKDKGDAIKGFVGTNTALSTLIDNVNKLPEIKVPDVVEDVKEGVKDAANDIKEGAEDLKDKAAEKVEDVKDAAGDAAKDVKEKAEGAVNDVKDKAAEGLQNAADALKK